MSILTIVVSEKHLVLKSIPHQNSNISHTVCYIDFATQPVVKFRYVPNDNGIMLIGLRDVGDNITPVFSVKGLEHGDVLALLSATLLYAGLLQRGASVKMNIATNEDVKSYIKKVNKLIDDTAVSI